LPLTTISDNILNSRIPAAGGDRLLNNDDMSERHMIDYLDFKSNQGSTNLFQKFDRNIESNYTLLYNFDSLKSSAKNQDSFLDIDQGNSNGYPIDFSKSLAMRIYLYLKGIIHKDLRFEIVPDDIINITGNETKRWMCALEAYRQSPKPIQDINNLIAGILDINYAKYLKKVRAKSIIYSSGNTYLDPVDNKDIPTLLVDDIGQIFNFNYWFFWKEEPDDDLAYSEVPLKGISEHDKEIFRESVRELVKDVKIQIVEEDEILLRNSSSSGLDLKTFKSTPVFQLKENHNKFERKPSVTKRSFIHVKPAGIRDSVIQSVGRTNSIQLIEEQVSQIVEQIPYSLHIRNQEEFERKLDRFSAHYSYFFNRDIKKEGITKPRILITLMLEVLKEEFPECPAWKYSGIYDYWLVYDPQTEEKTYRLRGHGQGMANSLTTLMQCALFNICIKEFAEEEDISAGIGAIFLNDDCSVGFEEIEDLESYVDFEDTFLQRFDIIRNNEKSHRGYLLVFCEIYIWMRRYMKKDSYRITEIYNIFASQNIATAKILAANLSKHVNLTDLEGYLRDIVNFWGYEFYEGEWDKPYLFGGWFSPAMKGIRIDMLYYTGSYDEIKAYETIKSNPCVRKFKKKDKSIYLDPLSQIYGCQLHLPDDVKARLKYQMERSEIDRAFSRFKIREDAERCNNSYKKIRRETFMKMRVNRVNAKEMYKNIVTSFPEKDFLPTRELVVEVIDEHSEIELINFQSANPTLGIISYYNPGRIKHSIAPEKFSFYGLTSNRKMTAEKRHEVFKYISSYRDLEIGIDLIYDYSNLVHKVGSLEYNRPEIVRGVAETLFGNIFGVPLTKLVNKNTEEDSEVRSLLMNRNKSKIFQILLGVFGCKEAIRFIKENEYEDLENSVTHILRYVKQNAEKREFEKAQKDHYESVIIEAKELPKKELLKVPEINDFFSWLYNKGDYVVDSLVENIFMDLEIVVNFHSLKMISLEYSKNTLDESYVSKLITPLHKLVWSRSGGSLDANGLISIDGGGNAFDDEEEYGIDLFGD